MNKIAVGVDIGGTKTRVCLVDEYEGITAETLFDTNPQLGGKKLLSKIEDNIKEMIKKSNNKICGIGIGATGQIDKTGKVVSSTKTFKEWTGLNIKKELEDVLKIEVKVINDVQAMALGEFHFGGWEKINDSVCIALGTGVGGAIISNGKLITGSSGAAGEIGHMILYPKGKPCPCGNCGCIEAYLSGTAIEKEYYSKTGNRAKGSNIFCDNEDVNREIIEKYLFDLEQALISITNIFNPNLIIIGGGVAESVDKYLKQVEKRVKEKVLRVNQNVEVKASQLKGDAMVLGASSQFFRNK